MADVHAELSRDLSLFDITMIGVGAMIGAGIFVLTGIAAGAAGPALILSFALNGIITIFTAMTYAELGSAIPEAGGGYLWVREGLPGPNAFQAGWMSWFAHAVAGSLYALGFGSYIALVLSEFNIHMGGVSENVLHKVLAVVIILIFVAINFRGVSETGAVGNVITVLKIVILAVFIGSGIWAIYSHPVYLDKFENFAPNGMIGILNAMGLTFIAFEGYEIIVQAGEEVKNPRRTIPRAVFLSLLIVVPIYMLVAFVAIGAVNPETGIPTYVWLAEHAELGVAEAARQFMPFGTILLLIGGILSTMSALNATTFSSTRVSFAMGRDRNLPNAFAAINPTTRTPYKALMFSGTLILFMAIAIPIEDVAAAADIMFLLLFLQVNFAVITLRKKYGDRLRYGYLIPFFPVIPIIVIIIKFLLAIFMFNYSPIAWYFTLVWLAIGFILYYVYARPRKQSRERTPIILEERRIVEEANNRYTVLVPIANPMSLPALIRPAIQAARRHSGRIVLLHVITVPEQLPLSGGRRFIERSRSLTNQALTLVEEAGIPTEVLIRISHRPADAIIHTSFEQHVDLLLMGWRGEGSAPDTYIGSNIDRIVKTVNCEAMIIQQQQAPPYRRILVPIADPAQTGNALRAARLLTTDKDGSITVLHIASPDADEMERSSFMEALREHVATVTDTFDEEENRIIELREVVANDVVGALVQESSAFDCLVLGTTRDSWLRQRFVESKPMQIAKSVKPPVTLVQPKTGAVTFGFYQLQGYLRGGYKVVAPASEKELTEQGLLVSQEARETEDGHRVTKQYQVLLAGIMAFAGVIMMYVGYGESLTWYGAGLYFIGLVWFTWASLLSTRPIKAKVHSNP